MEKRTTPEQPPQPFVARNTSSRVVFLPRKRETPHARFSRCQEADEPSHPLSDAEIQNLNTYDFMAYLGKTVINPGGGQGRDQVLALARLRPACRVLEIGCGTGHVACHMAQHYGAEVTAIDVAPKMIHTARETVAKAGLGDHVRCEVADITALPFADSSFDVVICQAVLMFVNKQEALREIKRVLRPGGRFAGLEFAWRREPSETIRSTTYRICGCRTLEFYPSRHWGQLLQGIGLVHARSEEQRFAMLSIPGFLRDEGLANSLRIFGKVIRRRASLRRMAEIWGHFSRHRDYFSYAVLSGVRPA